MNTNDIVLTLFGIRLLHVADLSPDWILRPCCGRALINADLDAERLEVAKDGIIAAAVHWAR